MAEITILMWDSPRFFDLVAYLPGKGWALHPEVAEWCAEHLGPVMAIVANDGPLTRTISPSALDLTLTIGFQSETDEIAFRLRYSVEIATSRVRVDVLRRQESGRAEDLHRPANGLPALAGVISPLLNANLQPGTAAVSGQPHLQPTFNLSIEI